MVPKCSQVGELQEYRGNGKSVSSVSEWSGRPDLNRGPPAPKPAGLSFGSPSFSILFLKINEIEKYLVVAGCTEMWLRMHRVPPISPQRR